jgi:hypothetical protein
MHFHCANKYFSRWNKPSDQKCPLCNSIWTPILHKVRTRNEDKSEDEPLLELDIPLDPQRAPRLESSDINNNMDPNLPVLSQGNTLSLSEEEEEELAFTSSRQRPKKRALFIEEEKK